MSRIAENSSGLTQLMRRRAFMALGSSLLVGGLGVGCGRESKSPALSGPSQGKANVVATVGMVADLVRQVAGTGSGFAVDALMGPGVDPHLYKVAAEDVVKLQRAELVFYNGLHLEGKMQEVLSTLGGDKPKAIAVTDSVPRTSLLKPTGFEDQYDPHVWFDVETWSECIPSIVSALSRIRPSEAQGFQLRGEELRTRLKSLHQWVQGRAAEINESKRILVTSHDAFNYFGRAYGFRVVALQGVSTVTEAGLADMAKLVDFIKAQKVRAIFVESSVPHGTIERISRDAGVVIGGELFSDAMGEVGRVERDYDLGTYDGMIRHNVNAIVEALK